jgi:hypothetical protein
MCVDHAARPHFWRHQPRQAESDFLISYAAAKKDAHRKASIKAMDRRSLLVARWLQGKSDVMEMR